MTAGEKAGQGNSVTSSPVTWLRLVIKFPAFIAVGGNYVFTPIDEPEKRWQPLLHGRGGLFYMLLGVIFTSFFPP